MAFSFENPVFLWYLVSLPLLIITHFLSLRSAKRQAMKFANFHALKRIAGKKFITKNTLVLVTRLVVLTLLILSLSGIGYWYQRDRSDHNYVIALDVSSSMAAQDFSPTRLDAAKKYAFNFIETLDSQADIGIVVFSGVTLVEQTLTDDKEQIRISLEQIETVKAGGTDIPGAIITGTNLLQAQPQKGKSILLITDGSSTLGNFIDNSMDQAIAYAKEKHVVINALGIGSESSPIGYLPEYYNISATYNEDLLRNVTNQTGGILAQANNPDEIEEALETLNSQKSLAFEKVRLDQASFILGILLLFIEWGLINSRYRRIT